MDKMDKGTARTILNQFVPPTIEDEILIFPIKTNKNIKPAHLAEYIGKHTSALAAFGITALFVAGDPPKHKVNMLENREKIGQLAKAGYRIPGFAFIEKAQKTADSGKVRS